MSKNRKEKSKALSQLTRSILTFTQVRVVCYNTPYTFISCIEHTSKISVCESTRFNVSSSIIFVYDSFHFAAKEIT